ncbi:unnamed protein product, partial [Ectocarpus sp. 13 AM-2016]
GNGGIGSNGGDKCGGKCGERGEGGRMPPGGHLLRRVRRQRGRQDPSPVPAREIHAGALQDALLANNLREGFLRKGFHRRLHGHPLDPRLLPLLDRQRKIQAECPQVQRKLRFQEGPRPSAGGPVRQGPVHQGSRTVRVVAERNGAQVRVPQVGWRSEQGPVARAAGEGVQGAEDRPQGLAHAHRPGLHLAHAPPATLRGGYPAQGLAEDPRPRRAGEALPRAGGERLCNRERACHGPGRRVGSGGGLGGPTGSAAHKRGQARQEDITGFPGCGDRGGEGSPAVGSLHQPDPPDGRLPLQQHLRPDNHHGRVHQAEGLQDGVLGTDSETGRRCVRCRQRFLRRGRRRRYPSLPAARRGPERRAGPHGWRLDPRRRHIIIDSGNTKGGAGRERMGGSRGRRGGRRRWCWHRGRDRNHSGGPPPRLSSEALRQLPVRPVRVG